MINNSIIYKAVFLAVELSPTFLNRGTTNETFQHLKNKIPSEILRNSASVYESSGSQFFRTMTGIQSGPDAFDELNKGLL